LKGDDRKNDRDARATAGHSKRLPHIEKKHSASALGYSVFREITLIRAHYNVFSSSHLTILSNFT